jgi:rare lipoprotein A
LRSHHAMRVRPRHAVIGALALGSTVAAAAPAPAQPAPVHHATPAGSGGGASSAHRPQRATSRLVVRRRAYEAHAGRAVLVRGTLLPRRRALRVGIEGVVHGRWRLLGAARTRPNGHFDVRLLAHVPGTIRLRAVYADRRSHRAVRASAGSLRAYRSTLVSWYALYGGALACGGRLGYGTLGVANKTLPCGTRVTLRYHGRTVTVPVIDRGPYAGAREFDLTGATARRLRFDGVGVIWSTR